MELKAETRVIFGKGVQNLRKSGLLPAELYGRGAENQHITVRQDEFRKVLMSAGESTVIYLEIEGVKQPALVQDVQRDYLSGEILHVDFHKIRMDEKITARVPIEFVGQSPAVKEGGGILNKTLTELEVEALPADLPRSLAVDVSFLENINQSLRVKDIQVPQNVRIIVDAETVVVSVSPPLKEEEPAPAPALEEVKVESEEKAAERQAEKTTEENAVA